MANNVLTGTNLAMLTAFISYSHLDREFGGQARDVLGEVGIDAFLAHEDLEMSEEWQQRILEELRHCDLFVPLLSKNFLKSPWAPQEAGFIASRPPDEVVIAPLSIDGTIPFGFFGHVQSGHIVDGITRELLVEPLMKRFPLQHKIWKERQEDKAPTLTAEAKIVLKKMQSDSSRRGVFYFYDYDYDVRERGRGRTGLYLVCLHQRDLEIEADGRVLAELKAKGFVESYPLRMSQLPLKHQTAKDGFQLTDRGWRIAFE